MNAGTIITLGNRGVIKGSAGGTGSDNGFGIGPSGAGGDGVSNTGTIETLRNVGATPTVSGSSPVPEPSTWAMLVIGFPALAAASRAPRRELSRVGY